jgi:uncharacterized repeat protein (TIGR01451 family)
VKPGEALTYTLVLGNAAAAALPTNSGGVIAATIPRGTTFSAVSAGGSLVGNTVQWTFGSLNPAASRRFSYTVTVGSTLPDGTVLQSSAQVSDGTFSLVRAQASTDVKAVMPLALTVSINQDPVPALLNGLVVGLVTYEYKISNLGTMAMANVVLSDRILNDSALALSPTTGGATCSNNIAVCGPGAVTSWPIFSLAAGQTQTFTAVKQILAGTPSGAVVRSFANVDSPAGLLSQATDLVVQNGAGLQLALAEDHDPVKPGDAVSYTLVLGNTATLASSAVLVTATVPEGTTFVSASTGGTLVGTLVQWSVAGLAPGASQVFRYTVTAGSALPDGTTLKAKAEVSAGDTSLARAQVATDVVAAPPVTVVVTAVGSVGSASFTATVTNTSAVALANVALSVLVVNNAAIALNSTTPTASCSNNVATCAPGAVLSWPAFSLAAGASQSFTWISQVLAGTPRGTVVRTPARVTAGNSAGASEEVDFAVN